MEKNRSVLTYSFGTNTDPLRDPLVIDSNVEYVCVTDNRNLTSKVWNMVYKDFTEVKSSRDKTVLVKFDPFSFVKTRSVCVIDATLEIKSSLSSLFDLLDKEDLIFKKHPIRNTLSEELPMWFSRGLTQESFQKFLLLASHDRVDLRSVFQFEGCLFLLNDTDLSRHLMRSVIKYARLLGTGETFIPTNQCPLSYAINRFCRNSIGIIDMNVQQIYFNRYHHNGEINLT